MVGSGSAPLGICNEVPTVRFVVEAFGNVSTTVLGDVTAPVEEIVVVPVPPKYEVLNTESSVEEASRGKSTRFGSEIVGVVPPEDVI